MILPPSAGAGYVSTAKPVNGRTSRCCWKNSGLALPPEERAQIYAEWLAEVSTSGGVGALIWMIGVAEAPGQLYSLDPYAITDGPELAILGPNHS